MGNERITRYMYMIELDNVYWDIFVDVLENERITRYVYIIEPYKVYWDIFVDVVIIFLYKIGC